MAGEGDRSSLVSVITPVWNSERTVLETLQSVGAQTHKNIEILIIDDGSTDDSVQVANRFCEHEPRARLVRQEHAGVAAARNRGISETRGAWLAPIDSDDLWHPEKIERQLRAFARGGPRLGLVYNWFRKIDGEGRVVEPPFTPVVEGRVLREHLKWNFIANGSTPMIRRAALDGLRYNPDLQAAGNQGCEDFLLQLQIAERFEFACVPAFLTGYRQARDAMSANISRMIRSHIQMYRILQGELGRAERRTIDRQLGRYLAAGAMAHLSKGSIRAAVAEFGSAVTQSPAAAGLELGSLIARRARRFYPGPTSEASRSLVGRMFASLSPEDGSPL